MKEVMLFDLDDTLVEFKESFLFWYPLFNKLFKEFNTGIHLTEEEYKEELNKGIDIYIESIDVDAREFWQRFDKEDFINRRKGIEEGRICLFEDTIEVLEYGREKGYKLGIVTNTGRKCAEMEMDLLGIIPYFEVIIARDDKGCEAKPSPVMVNKAMELLGATKGYFIGDTWKDVEAGRRAGLTTILVSNHMEEINCKPDYLIRKLKHLKKIIT